jgi:hypothetical protein
MKKAILFSILLGFAFAGARAITIEKARIINPQIAKIRKNTSPHSKVYVDFLLQYLPTVDLVSLDADSFLGNLNCLDSVYSKVNYGKKVPNDLILHYVITTRVSQEPLEYFRLVHWKELLEKVKDCPDMKSAAYKLNEWAFEEMKYEPTSRWDQSAEQTLRRGIGRCEEMAILFIDACRAMGIPARDAFTPYWPFTNSNHAWVEVWLDGGWYFVGGAEMTPLGGAWFSEPSKRAAIIKGVVLGKIEKPDCPIYQQNEDFTVLNLTPLYSDTTGLTVRVLDARNEPVESADVWISIFNYSCIRTVAHQFTDKKGKAHIAMGKAELFVSASKDSAWDWTIQPFAEENNTAGVTLKLSKKTFADTSFWLRTRKVQHIEKTEHYEPPKESYLRHDLKQANLKACDDGFVSLFNDSSFAKRILTAANFSGSNRKELLAFLKAHKTDAGECSRFIESFDVKDILLPDSAQFETLFLHNRDMKSKFTSFGFADSLFWNYVCPPRVLFENFDDWFISVSSFVKDIKFTGISDFAKKIALKIDSKIDTVSDKSYYGGMMNPAQLLLSKTGSESERLALLVASFRTCGIPSRISWDYTAAEYFVDNGWKRVILQRKSDKKQNEKRRTAKICAQFTDNNAPTTNIDYYENFCIAKLTNGNFDDIPPPFEVKDSQLVFTDVEYGEYYIFSGWRNTSGDAFVRAKRLNVETDSLFVKLTLGIPPSNKIDKKDLLVRAYSGFGKVSLSDIDKKPLDIDDLRKGKVIVAFFDTEHESSISTAQHLFAVKYAKVYCFVTAKNETEARSFSRRVESHGRLFFADEQTLQKLLPFQKLPSIAVFENGEALLWTEGINLDISGQVKSLFTGK